MSNELGFKWQEVVVACLGHYFGWRDWGSV